MPKILFKWSGGILGQDLETDIDLNQLPAPESQEISYKNRVEDCSPALRACASVAGKSTLLATPALAPGASVTEKCF